MGSHLRTPMRMCIRRQGVGASSWGAREGVLDANGPAPEGVVLGLESHALDPAPIVAQQLHDAMHWWRAPRARRREDRPERVRVGWRVQVLGWVAK